MKIFQFISEYCQDLVEEHKLQKNLIDLSEFPHDEIITDVEGKQVPVVYVDTNPIPVSDFLTLAKDDFVKACNTPSAGEMYTNYMSALSILEGEDALNKIRNAILAEKERLSQSYELITDI